MVVPLRAMPCFAKKCVSVEERCAKPGRLGGVGWAPGSGGADHGIELHCPSGERAALAPRGAPRRSCISRLHAFSRGSIEALVSRARPPRGRSVLLCRDQSPLECEPTPRLVSAVSRHNSRRACCGATHSGAVRQPPPRGEMLSPDKGRLLPD